MLPLDRAITTTYKLLKVTMPLSAAVWPQFWMPSLTCAKLSYRTLALILAFGIATSPARSCMGLKSLWEIAIFPQQEVAHWPSNRRYGQPIPATAGILVLQDAGCVYAYRYK